MYNKNNDLGWGTIIICIILIIIILFSRECANTNHIQSTREEQHMVLIDEGFTYDKNTKIIYREIISGRGKYSYDSPSYTPYLNENGNMCKFVNNEWIEIIKNNQDNY